MLLLAAATQAQDFFPIDSFEMSPDKPFADLEDYFTRGQTSRSDDDEDYYPSSEYDSFEEEDDHFSSLDYDPQENEALFDSPSRQFSDTKQKRQEYFEGLAKKVHRGPPRKNLDLVAGASDHFPRQRSERNKRARLSDYDLYYPKRNVNSEHLRSNPKPKPQSESFDFDDFFHTTMSPMFDSERPLSSGFQDHKESRSQIPYDEPPKPTSSHSVKPRKRLPGFDDDSYNHRKPSHSVKPRRPSSFDDSHSHRKPSHSVEPRRPTSFDDSNSHSKPSHSVDAWKPSSFDDSHSYRKPSHSKEPRRPSSDFSDDFHSYSKPSHSVEPRRPSPGHNDESHSYNKPSHFREPKRPAFNFHDDSFSKPPHSIHDEPRRPSLESYTADFDAKPFMDEPRKPSPGFAYHTESYPKHQPTESHRKKPARKIRQRSKRIEVEPYKLKSLEPESLSQFFSVPKAKDSSSARVRSSPRKFPEVHGRGAVFDDDFAASPPASPSFRKERRRPGLFTEEKEHYLSATGYGKPVREQFHEQVSHYNNK